jgi:prephenate dehydrogenase
LAGLRIVISEHTLEAQGYAALKTALEALGLVVIEAGADAHDKMLAETLFLTHYVSQSIANAGFVRTDIDTLSFGYLMDAVESTKNDLALFRDVYEFNPYCTETVRRLKEAERKVETLLAEPR